MVEPPYCIILATVVLVIFRLFKDEDGRSFPNEKSFFQNEDYKGSSLTNLVVLVVALIGSYFLVRFIKWAWLHL
jgi:hypothetical protein